jgi:hypothetical protein
MWLTKLLSAFFGPATSSKATLKAYKANSRRQEAIRQREAGYLAQHTPADLAHAYAVIDDYEARNKRI